MRLRFSPRSAVAKAAQMLLGCAFLTSAVPAAASQPAAFVADGDTAWFAGQGRGMGVTDGALVPGYTASHVRGVPGVPVAAVVQSGQVYVATIHPHAVWRVADAAAEKVADIKAPMITGMTGYRGGRLLVSVAPKGALHVVSTAKKTVERVVTAPAGVLLAGVLSTKDGVFAVGGGTRGHLLSWDGEAKTLAVRAQTKETVLAALHESPRGLLVGGGTEGRVYRLEASSKGQSKLRALADAAPTQVTAMLEDRAGRVFVALVDTAGRLSNAGTARDKGREAGEGSKNKVARGPRRVRSSEVLRIDADGRVDVLWHSEAEGVYGMRWAKGALELATGARGRVLSLDPNGDARARVVGAFEDVDELIAFLPGGRVLAAAPAGVLALERAAGNARSSVWLSAVQDAGAQTKVGHVSWRAVAHGRTALKAGSVLVQVRTGQTDAVDDTWSDFSSPLTAPGVPDAPRGRYVQTRVTFKGPARLSALRVAHLVDNRKPEVSAVEPLAPGWVLVGKHEEPDASESVTLEDDAFEGVRLADRHTPAEPKKLRADRIRRPGMQTVVVTAADPDQDTLRYRFWIAPLGSAAGSKRVLQDWSPRPYVSFDAAPYDGGAYRVGVDVDDQLSNGAVRARMTHGQAVWRANLAAPVLRAEPITAKGKTRGRAAGAWRMQVTAGAPLLSMRCTRDGAARGLLVDSVDGAVDGPDEVFVLPRGTLACVAEDVDGNTARWRAPRS